MFRTIVMMGSSLAVGCGGVAQLSGSSPGAGGSAGSSVKGGSGGVSGSGLQGSAGSPGGGVSAIGVGGTLAFAGAPNIAGMPGLGGTVGSAGSQGLPTGCPPPQWACSSGDGSGFQCDFNGGFTPLNCQCDFSRPKEPGDCKPGTTYTCLRSDNAAYSPFQCACTPDALPACADRCTGTTHVPDVANLDCEPQSSPDEILCGCAVVVLK